MTEERLLSTGEAADALQVDRTTLARWARAGRVTPASKTIGGYLRWDLAKLRAELESLGAAAPDQR